MERAEEAGPLAAAPQTSTEPQTLGTNLAAGRAQIESANPASVVRRKNHRQKVRRRRLSGLWIGRLT